MQSPFSILYWDVPFVYTAEAAGRHILSQDTRSSSELKTLPPKITKAVISYRLDKSAWIKLPLINWNLFRFGLPTPKTTSL